MLCLLMLNQLQLMNSLQEQPHIFQIVIIQMQNDKDISNYQPDVNMQKPGDLSFYLMF